MAEPIIDVLSKLDRFGIATTNHSQSSLLEHLKGTYDVLQRWSCASPLCLAGLCHSIYGTESFLKAPATLENRDYLRSLIGNEAEQLSYWFGAHKKDSLWRNLDRESEFEIEDRFEGRRASISAIDLANLITLTLANWLEQRPRAEPKFKFLRQAEFLRAKSHLPPAAFKEFQKAYGLQADQ